MAINEFQSLGENAKVDVPFIIFINPNCSYPIRGLQDNSPKVAYCTSVRGFMTQELLGEYLKEVVEEFNKLRDSNGVSYVTKAMIRCGLSKNTDGVRSIDQLSPELQDIVSKYPEEFEE
ncbi:hypothetical protein RCL1_003210 [Eukaryota sp. TZLM3-RCL]